MGARHQPQPLPPQKAVQIIKSIYAERSEFECQAYPPGISAFAELAANGMAEEMGSSVGLPGSIYWSAYTARLCHRRVETCHVAVRARAKGAPPPITVPRHQAFARPLTAAADVPPPCTCLSARWPLNLLIMAAIGVATLNVVCYSGCLLLCCREWWCQSPKLKRFQYF